MAHNEQREFIQIVKDVFPEYFEWTTVLEVGSLDINGTVRDFFTNCAYVGCDIGPGNGVDIVCGGQDLRFPPTNFDVAISAECFEHNPYWLETFRNMTRMTKLTGMVVFTCAGEGRPEHGTTRSDIGSSPLTVGAGWEYYRNLTPEDFQTVEYDVDMDYDYWTFAKNSKACDLYFVGFLEQAGADFASRFNRLEARLSEIV